MPVVLDSSFLVDVARRRAAALRLLDRLMDEGEAMLIPSVVIAEYLAGVSGPDAEYAQLEKAAQVLSFAPADARRAAAYARAAFDQGRFPGWMDTLIAGFALERGGFPVVTANPQHFVGVSTITY